MELDTCDVPVDGAGQASATGSARRWWIRGSLAVLVALALGGVGLLAFEWRHPSAFPDAGGWGVGSRHQPLDEPVFVAMTYPDLDSDETVRVDRVTGHGVTDSADAELAYLVCTLRPRVEGAIGSADRATADKYCSALTPADGVTLSLGRHPREQLLLEVTLTRPGVVRIHGLDVTYAHGWQHGTQHIGGDVALRAVEPRR